MPTEFPDGAPKISNRRTVFIIGLAAAIVTAGAMVAYFGG